MLLLIIWLILVSFPFLLPSKNIKICDVGEVIVISKGQTPTGLTCYERACPCIHMRTYTQHRLENWYFLCPSFE